MGLMIITEISFLIFLGISRKAFKLIYLLKLSNELQNWNKPNYENSNGDSSENYDIEVLNNKLIFKVKTDESKNELLDNIKCLDDNSIEVVKNE